MPKSKKRKTKLEPRILDDVLVTVVTAPSRTLDDITVKKGKTK